MDLNILYEDDFIIVCHKQAGLAVQTKNLRQTDLESIILNEYSKMGKKTELYVVHRLDQPVEGIIVFAKTSQAAADLSRQFQSKNIVKNYLAVVEGKPKNEGSLCMHLENYLLKDGKNNLSRVVKEGTKNSKLAVLDISFLASKEDTNLVMVHLETGRHHQIRVQLSNAGYPIVGDKKYNAKYINKRDFIQTALCAYSLEFVHPENKKIMNFKVLPNATSFLTYNKELLQILK